MYFHPTDLTVQFQPYDSATKRGALPSDSDLQRFLDEHGLVLIDVGAGSAYRVKATRPINSTFSELQSDARIFRVERVLVTDCAAQ